MQTIKNNSTYELIIKNSKFITILTKIKKQEDIEITLNNLKQSYPDATHYCYAYILENIKKASDDGEPAGTAGIPILKVIENNNLTNILIVVIRYFGGIKLGANGLIRAYTKVTANALKESIFTELIDGINIDITFDYPRIKEIDYILKDIQINNKLYNDKITYNIDIPVSNISLITDNLIDYTINKYIKIEK